MCHFKSTNPAKLILSPLINLGDVLVANIQYAQMPKVIAICPDAKGHYNIYPDVKGHYNMHVQMPKVVIEYV